MLPSTYKSLRYIVVNASYSVLYVVNLIDLCQCDQRDGCRVFLALNIVRYVHYAPELTGVIASSNWGVSDSSETKEKQKRLTFQNI